MKLVMRVVAAVALVGAVVLTAVSGCAQRGQQARGTDSRGLYEHRATGGVPAGALAAEAFGTAAKAEPGSLPSAFEELWIIQRPREEPAREPRAYDDVPGCGALMTALPGRDEPVPVPLEHTDVRASVAGFVATTDVEQTFHNPFAAKIEAVYVFPLPENAAVSEFVMSIGERRIRGVIRDREEAEEIYREARAAGHVASLLTQERPNIFMQKVANIEPGRRIGVSIRYFHTLAYDDGWLEYVFPMVVGPRFNPSGSTGGIGAVGRRSRGASGQDVEVQHLRPTERSGHEVSLAVDIRAGVVIEDIVSRSHRIDVQRLGEDAARVRLSSGDAIPNKDFVLRCRVAGEGINPGMVAHRTVTGDGYFALMLVPPAQLERQARQPMELVFVLDCSGSMRGQPLKQARDAVRHALSRLDRRDTFQIIRFSDSSSSMGARPVPATRENIRRGREYLDSLHGEGGTMMIEGIRAALNFPHDKERLRFVVFLTDGYIGNEREILGEMRRLLGPSRVFSFGVGSSPNRFLMDRMAKLGRGAVAYLGTQDDGADVMDRFLARASRPALIDVEVEWGSMEAAEVYPSIAAAGGWGRTRAPDLFIGRPVVLTGRFSGTLPDRIRVHGRAGGRRITMDVPVRDAGGGPSSLAQVWARHRIADLADRQLSDRDVRLAEQIRATALSYGLLSAYTAFVAADVTRRTEGEYGVSVAVPVPVPDGVRYDTTVNEGRGPGLD